MQSKRPPLPSPALIVSVIALVVAMAGTAIAGSDAAKDLTKKRVKKVAAKQITKLVPDLVDKGIDRRAPGLAVASAATAQRAETFAADASLRSGETLTGVWAVAGGTGQNAPEAISFVPQLPSPLGAGDVHRLAPGATSAACPGPGSAAPGNLCVYERAAGSVNFNTIADPATGSNGANRRGAVIQYVTTASNAYADGTWAVTGP